MAKRSTIGSGLVVALALTVLAAACGSTDTTADRSGGGPLLSADQIAADVARAPGSDTAAAVASIDELGTSSTGGWWRAPMTPARTCCSRPSASSWRWP